MVWLAILLVVLAYGHTVITYTQCPKHSDVFDAMVCPLCSIKMHRQDEIDDFVDRFKQGYVPTFEDQPPCAT